MALAKLSAAIDNLMWICSLAILIIGSKYLWEAQCNAEEVKSADIEGKLAMNLANLHCQARWCVDLSELWNSRLHARGALLLYWDSHKSCRRLCLSVVWARVAISSFFPVPLTYSLMCRHDQMIILISMPQNISFPASWIPSCCSRHIRGSQFFFSSLDQIATLAWRCTAPSQLLFSQFWVFIPAVKSNFVRCMHSI